MIFKRLHMGTVSFGEDSVNDITEYLYDAFALGILEDCFSPLASGLLRVVRLSSCRVFPQHGKRITPPRFFATESGHHKDKKTITTEAEASMLSDNASILRSTQMRVRDVVLAIALCHNVRVVSTRAYMRAYLAI